MINLKCEYKFRKIEFRNEFRKIEFDEKFEI